MKKIRIIIGQLETICIWSDGESLAQVLERGARKLGFTRIEKSEAHLLEDGFFMASYQPDRRLTGRAQHHAKWEETPEKNAAASALGKLAKGKPKTMSPEAIAQRKKASEKLMALNAERRAKNST